MKHNSFNGGIKRFGTYYTVYPSRFKSTRSINTYGLYCNL